jgi:hypothetical protein
VRDNRVLAGKPSHDHLGDIFATLDAGQFQRCFVAWVSSLTGVSAEVFAIDGKTVRRSGHKTAAHQAAGRRCTWSRPLRRASG